MNEYPVIKLYELFDEKDLKILKDLINKNKCKEIRKFLEERGTSLLKKGIIHDYLYYYLIYHLNLNENTAGNGK